MKSFDLVIIGSGPGGYEAAIKASCSGLSVALIEKNSLGGTCLNVGCIPTKALYQSAKIAHSAKNSLEFGINLPEFSVDMDSVINRKNQIVDQLVKNIYSVLMKSGVTIFCGVGSFIDERRIHISNERDNEIIEYKNCLIATGSKEFIIPIPGKEHCLTSKEILDLKEIPEKLVIIGGGVIGCEMAAIYHQLGVKVVIIEALDRILYNLDSDIANRLKALMKRDGIEVHNSTKVMEIIKENQSLVVKAENKRGQEVKIETSHVLMAVGRKPCIDGLNLQQVGIDYNGRGIAVNDQFKTSLDNVFAVGDCIGGKMLAHTATFQSYLVLDQILQKENQTDFSITPACVFTFPEIATVGLTEEEAKAKFENIQIAKSLFRANGKANAMGAVDGFVKLVKQGDYLVGAHILGEGASTIIHEASLIIAKKLKISECVNLIHAHPTLSEVLLEALRGLCE